MLQQTKEIIFEVTNAYMDQKMIQNFWQKKVIYGELYNQIKTFIGKHIQQHSLAAPKLSYVWRQK